MPNFLSLFRGRKQYVSLEEYEGAKKAVRKLVSEKHLAREIARESDHGFSVSGVLSSIAVDKAIFTGPVADMILKHRINKQRAKIRRYHSQLG